ncbi:MAG: NADH-quinone oxidoreductase subunit N [Syntrophus sp. SKADARSKE-3]|nr:NADH-quinone oxidoreductase subunit N [Syntrophus sp. SKADARSKE-3]
MMHRDIIAFIPFLMLAAAPVAIMIVAAIRRSHGIAFTLATGGIGLALLSLPAAASPVFEVGMLLLLIDRYALFFIALILLAGLATLLLSYGYLDTRREEKEEFYILILTALLGAAILVSSAHLAAFFLGLEILSVSLYALIAYERVNESGLEAGIKYLILATFSSAFLVFGMALIYAELGTLSFSRIALKLAGDGMGHILLTGVILVSIGIGFKLAVVPFHMWVADVYEGAPAPVTAFIASVSKGAVFALLLRFSLKAEMLQGNPFGVFIAVIAVASMITGNLLALFQDNVKRLLAYSSIAHMGYLLVAFLAGGPLRITAIVFYLIGYIISIIGAFGVVTLLSGPKRDAGLLDDYRGLFFRRPWLAGAFTAILLSLAGIPLTVGFIGKFTVLAAGVGSFLWIPVGTLIVTSAIGLFYYLRVLVTLYNPPTAAVTVAAAFMPAGVVTLVILTAMILGLGIYPGPILEAISALQPFG